MRKLRWKKWHWIKTSAPKPREFKFKNLLTNEIISGYNLRKWCQDNKFNSVSNYISFLGVLNGRYGRYKNFSNINSKIKVPEIKNLKTGEIHRDLTAKNLGQKIGLKRDKVEHLISGKISRVNEWVRSDSNIKIDDLPLIKNNITGQTFRIFEKFCTFTRNNNINPNCLKYRGKYKEWEWINK